MADKEIVVIEVDNISQGQYIIDELEVQEKNGLFDVDDAALAYEDHRSRVKIRLTKELTTASSGHWGVGIGLVVGLFVRGPVKMAPMGTSVPAGIDEGGITHRLAEKYRKHMTAGHALVFVQIEGEGVARLVEFLDGKAWQLARYQVNESQLEAAKQARETTGFWS